MEKDTKKIIKIKNRFGVPCSGFKDWLNGDEIPCTNESEAMAIAAGAWFAGKKPTVYLQNSGLGNIVDIVTSLYKPYEIPLPNLIISLRHTPNHHKVMGKMTHQLLRLMNYNSNIKILEQENPL